MIQMPGKMYSVQKLQTSLSHLPSKGDDCAVLLTILLYGNDVIVPLRRGREGDVAVKHYFPVL